MPIYQIYIIVIVLATLFLGGGIAYFIIQERGQDDVTVETPDAEMLLTEKEKRSILDLLLPSTDTVSPSTGERTNAGQGRTQETNSGTGAQAGGDQDDSAAEPDSQSEADSGDSVSEEDKQKILEDLESGSGDSVSDEEKQDVLESLQ